VSDQLIDKIMPRLTDRIHQLMTQQGVPGVALGIVRDQELIWSQGFGYADLATARPMDADTVCGVASITKTFTATAILQLRDKEKLSLDDPVTRYLPEVRKVRRRFVSISDLTLRRLLTHRSGLVGEAPGGPWWSLTFPSMAAILAKLNETEIVIPPDSAFKYNNLAFALLGEVVARVSRRSYREYVRRNILEPLEMTASGYEVSNPNNATGYMPERYQDVPEVSPDPPTNGYLAAAGLRSCVTDLSKWLALQFRAKAGERAGAQVLAGKTLSEMHRVTFVEHDWIAGYALTWMALRAGENIYMNHGGSVPGFLSMIAFNKPNRVGVVVLTNKQGHVASSTIAFEAMEMLVGEVKKGVRPPSAVAVPENLKPVLGRYEGMPAFGVIFHIEWRGGALQLVTPADPFMVPMPPAPLVTTDKPDTFIVEVGRIAGEPLRFERDAHGKVVGFILSENGGLFRKVS
jgi:D-alanyl-D-alanine carboxypeptidase